MAAQSRVYRLSRWKQWQYTIMPWLPGTLLAIALIGGITYAVTVLPLKDQGDVQGAAQEHGRGVVLSVDNTFGVKSPTQPPALASVVLSGETVTFWTHADLHKGEPVQVTYRVGRSGRIHIDDAEPVGKTRP